MTHRMRKKFKRRRTPGKKRRLRQQRRWKTWSITITMLVKRTSHSCRRRHVPRRPCRRPTRLIHRRHPLSIYRHRITIIIITITIITSRRNYHLRRRHLLCSITTREKARRRSIVVAIRIKASRRCALRRLVRAPNNPRWNLSMWKTSTTMTVRRPE